MAPPTRVATQSMLRKGRTITVSSKALQTQPLQHADFAIEDSAIAKETRPELSRTMEVVRRKSALSILPLSTVLRSLVITTVSGSPALLTPSLKLMSVLSHPESRLNPDRSLVMRRLLKGTIYRQFCAGETEAEVKPTVAALKDLGLSGVILNYAKEIIISDSDMATVSENAGVVSETTKADVAAWKSGTMATVSMTEAGDYIAMKWTGAGNIVVDALKAEAAMPAIIDEATAEICDLALSRGVQILIDAEQACLQPTVDKWAVDVMRKYHRKGSGKAVIYNTYQAYLKSIPTVLAQHLAVARKEGFTLGVKLVRGAYLGTDPRQLIHDTKADTDKYHDAMAESLVTSKYNTILQPAAGEAQHGYPSVNVVLAGHNLESIRRVQAIRTRQAERGEKQVDLVYAQLQGMADEITCELMQLAQQAKGSSQVDIPKAYKYISWGTVGQCMGYLHRRGQENKDAAQRTRDTRNAMWTELTRRVRMGIGLQN